MPKARDRHTVTSRLFSGGVVKIEVSANPLELESTDRDFVFKLLDEVRLYDQVVKDMKTRGETASVHKLVPAPAPSTTPATTDDRDNFRRHPAETN